MLNLTEIISPSKTVQCSYQTLIYTQRQRYKLRSAASLSH